MPDRVSLSARTPGARQLLDLVGTIGRAHPRASLRLADFIGRFTAPLRRHSYRDLEQICPDLSRAEAKRIMRHILAMETRNGVVARIGSISSFTRSFAGTFQRLEPPAILATFHIGPLFALPELLRGLPADRKYTFVRTGPGPHRARGILDAAKVLRGSGVVSVAIDVPGESAMSIRFFSSTIPVSRGAFALSRITAVPVVPLLFVWRNDEIVAVFGDPILPPERGSSAAEDLAAETAVANAVVQWAERYLRQNPRDLGVRATMTAWWRYQG